MLQSQREPWNSDSEVEAIQVFHLAPCWTLPAWSWVGNWVIVKVERCATKTAWRVILSELSLDFDGGSFTVHLLIFFWVGFRWDGHYGPEMGGMDPNPPIEMRVPPMPTRSWHPKKTSTTADLSAQTVPMTPFCQRPTSRRWQQQKTSSTVGSSTQDICSAFLLISWMRNNRNFTDWKTTAAGGTWRCLLKTAKRSASPNAVSLWISISGGSISPPSLVFVVQPWAFPILVWKEWPSQLGLTASFSSFSSLHCQGCTSLFCAFPGGESLPHRADHWPPGQDKVPQCCLYQGPIRFWFIKGTIE